MLLHISNRFEELLDTLVNVLARPPISPFDTQQIIVPSRAIQRTIELALADRMGICANVEFSFLAQWLWRQIARLVPVADSSPFAPPVLAWRIFEILGDQRFVTEHPRLARYLRDADALMRYELAQRVASLFDQYITYRPDWLARWVEGQPVPDLAQTPGAIDDDQRWQAAVWRRIAADIGTTRRHPSTAFFDAVASAGPELLRNAGIPASAHVFALPTIPPLYLDMLRQLGRFVDLRVSVLNPCREYWFDVVDRRRLSYLRAQGTLDYHEEGNRLLASWGKQRQTQLKLLFDGTDDARLDDDRFVEAPGKSLLAQVQNAILDLHELAPGSLAGIPATDRSIEVHVCHSLTRELEVLHDALLGLFAGRNPPRPGDIVVVTPNLDEAAPLIDAVFGTVERKRKIPYVITGRGRSTVNQAARALLALLDVATSRFAASAVMELLQQPIIARRFDVGPAELENIREWIGASGARWGVDAAHRQELGLPALERHTLEDGLARLFMGYALASPGDAVPGAAPLEPLGDRLPAGNAEGTEALALGSLSAFVDALDALRKAVAEPKSTAAWMQVLLDALAAFVDPEGDEVEDARELRAAIGVLHEQMDDGGLRGAVPIDVVRAALEAVLDDPSRGGVPTGAVTFSAMASLRDLPFKVVCVLGLSDGAFPGTSRPAEFDLMDKAPRAGDRQRRDDDRNVFLDLLLAARERLYLSYSGRSIRDNAPLPPSVLVSELLDVLVPAIAPAQASARDLAEARHRLVVEHPLQAFSLDAFGADPDQRKRSYNADYAEALRRKLQVQARSRPAGATVGTMTPDDLEEPPDEDEVDEILPPFFVAPLALRDDAARSVTVVQLVNFFTYPSRFLLRERLQIRLDDEEDELLDDEPFVIDLPARKALAARLLPLYLRGVPAGEIRALARAGTEYPPGRLGERLLERELTHFDVYARDLAPLLAPPCLEPVEHTITVEVDGEPWQVVAEVGDLRATGLVRHRYDKARATDYLTGWIWHLVLNAAMPAGVEAVTHYQSRDGRYRLPPVADAAARLQTLVQLHARGLTEPLHFYPRSAWEYAKSGGNLNRAASQWQGHQAYGGEKAYAAYRLALRGVENPLDEGFEQCAKAVFDPMLAVIDDPRLKR
jgi:exodeoxyribonuclease V gamma subunit